MIESFFVCFFIDNISLNNKAYFLQLVHSIIKKLREVVFWATSWFFCSFTNFILNVCFLFFYRLLSQIRSNWASCGPQCKTSLMSCYRLNVQSHPRCFLISTFSTFVVLENAKTNTSWLVKSNRITKSRRLSRSLQSQLYVTYLKNKSCFL